MTDFQKAKEAAALSIENQLPVLPHHVFAVSYPMGLVDAALSAFREAGYALVPVEPTDVMQIAGTKAADDRLASWRGYDPADAGVDGMGLCVQSAYTAMLTAAQKEQEG